MFDRCLRLARLLLPPILLFIALAPAAPAQLPDLPGMPAAPQTDDASDTTAEQAGSSDSDGSLLSSIDVDLLVGNDLTAWLTLLAAIFVGVAAGRVLAGIMRRGSKHIEDSRFDAPSLILSSAASPISLVITTLAMHLGVMQLELGTTLLRLWPEIVEFLLYIALFWFLFNGVALAEAWMKKFVNKREPSELAKMTIPLVRKSLRIFVVVWGFIMVAQNVFGQDIGAWLAGLGIAGLAISLAAQDSLKNLFGSITILLDKPFKVGDRILYQGYDGPVEEIGFRSTKVRTLTGHLVTIPNSNIVNDPVENIAARPYIRRIMNITITYDTPLESIQKAVQLLRDIFEEEGIAEPIHGSIGEDTFPPRVYFNDYNDWSLNLIVIYWFFPPAYWDFLEHAQAVNLRIFEEFGKAGIDFAFPSRTLYIGNKDREKMAIEMLNRGLDDALGGELPGDTGG